MLQRIRTLLSISAAAALGALACSSPDVGEGALPVHVSAASSLQSVLPELGAAFTAGSGTAIVASYGSTGSIAAQMEAGAPIDLFLAADRASVDRLAGKGLVVAPAPYAVGVLVLAACAEGAKAPVSPTSLAEARYARIGLANSDIAPYGRAGREALERAGVWTAVQSKVITGENVGVTREHCATGNVDAAFLPRSLADGAGIPYLIIDGGAHAPIEHWLAVPRSAGNPKGAFAFAAFLATPAARAILSKSGFAAPGGGP